MIVGTEGKNMSVGTKGKIWVSVQRGKIWVSVQRGKNMSVGILISVTRAVQVFTS